MLPKINPTNTKSWKALKLHYTEMQSSKMQELFKEDNSRSTAMRLDFEDLSLDYSKNRITKKTLELLESLANECGLKEAIEAQFEGQEINETENRAVLHTALRNLENLKPEVAVTLEKMKVFSDSLIQGTHLGHTGKKITDVVNIGIGGSDLGPAMVTEGLSYYKNHLKVHYISNIDGDHVSETLKFLDPETTLFIIVSKTFTTQETITNATTIRKWFLQKAPESAISSHFVAVSTNKEAVRSFGIDEDQVFTMWNWVGGRFSLWSAVGLSTCCAIGYDNFKELLAGASAMDTHFKEAPFSKNMPVLMAMISVWYSNFYNAETEAVLPYTQYLTKFVDYLQQAIMESNGKSIDRNGNRVNYTTGTIVWGNTGTNSQHAFLQLLHQGTRLIPTDFICYKESLYGNKDHHKKLIANCYAQGDALLNGTYGETVDAPYKIFEGNKPSNLIEINKLTPRSLGKLIALYEHKIFVQGIIWNIYSYDQWGVELGKKMANSRLESM